VTERQSYILRVRELVKACGQAWLATEAAGVKCLKMPELDAEQMGEPHNAEKIRKVANLALEDALQITALVEVLKRQNTDGINARLSKAGAGRAGTAVRNAIIGYLVLLIARAYAEAKPGDLHVRVAAELLKSDKTAREIFDSSNTPKKVADFEAHWTKCCADHRLQRIKHFRDKYTAHLGEPKDIPGPEYAQLFGFADATAEAMELLAFATRVAAKSIKENGNAPSSAEAFWKPWTKD
jgi:hypothetical protein